MIKLSSATARRILLIAYGCTLMLVFPFCLGASLIPDTPPLLDILAGVGLLAASYLPHQICAYFHLRKNYRIVSFQKVELIIDLFAVIGYALMATNMGKTAVVATWFILYIVLQRTIALLWVFKKVPGT